MADTRGIRAGRAFVELGVNDQLAKGLAAAQKKLIAFGNGLQTVGKWMMGLGGAALGGLFSAARAFGEAGDDLLKMSSRTGASVEALSELGFAARQSDLDMETLEKGIRLMQKTIAQAEQGSDSAAKTLEQLGISVTDIAALSPDRQFELVADAVSRIRDPALKATTAMEIFGRSGTALLPMLEGGAAGLQAMRQQAREFGLAASQEGAEKAAKLDDALKLLWAVSSKVYKTIGEALAPTITDLADAATRVIVGVIGWIKQNQALVVTIFKVAAAAFSVGAGLFLIGKILVTAMTAFSTLGAIISGVGGVLGTIGTIIVGLISPLGILIVAIVGLGGAFLYSSGIGGKALAWLGEQFRSLLGVLSDVLGGIMDALKAGNIELAAKVLWLGLRYAWEEGSAALQRVWLTVKSWFVTGAYQMWYGALAAAENAWHGLEVGWIETTSFLSKTWERFTSFIALSWETIKNLASKAWNHIKGLFDEGFDVGAADLAADQALVQAEQQIGSERDKALAEIEAARKGKRDQAAQEHEATLALIGGDYERSIADLTASTDQKLAATKAALEAAKAELNQSLAQAKSERQAKETGGAPGGLASALAGLDDLLADLDLAGARIGVTGTFNASAAWGLGANSDAAERTAKATEATAANTRKIANQKPAAFA